MHPVCACVCACVYACVCACVYVFCLCMYCVTAHTFPHHTEICAICKGALRDPVELNCPGFCKYCRECALRWFGGCATNKCPKCNVDVTAMKYRGGAVPLRASTPTAQRPPPRVHELEVGRLGAKVLLFMLVPMAHTTGTCCTAECFRG